MAKRRTNDQPTSAPAPPHAFRHDLSLSIVGAFDLGGVLYHARYLELLEETRAAFLETHLCSYRSLMDAGYHIVVTQTAQRFLAPIQYGQPVAVLMWCTDLRHGMFVLDYSIHTWPTSTRPIHGSAIERTTEGKPVGISGGISGGKSVGISGGETRGVPRPPRPEDYPLDTSRRVHTATTRLAFVKRHSSDLDDPRYALSRVPEPVAAALRQLVVGEETSSE